jgi:hypothetical protein
MVKIKGLKVESKTIGAKITKGMYERILEFLATNSHISISDYLRDLIRKDLEIKEVRS